MNGTTRQHVGQHCERLLRDARSSCVVTVGGCARFHPTGASSSTLAAKAFVNSHRATVSRGGGPQAPAERLITSAAAAAHAAAAGRRLTREVDVLRHGRVEWVPIRLHGVAGEGRPFPWLDADKLCAGAAGDQRDRGRQQQEESYCFHDTCRQVFSARSCSICFRSSRSVASP
jgi:hypothetical protein